MTRQWWPWWISECNSCQLYLWNRWYRRLLAGRVRSLYLFIRLGAGLDEGLINFCSEEFYKILVGLKMLYISNLMGLLIDKLIASLERVYLTWYLATLTSDSSVSGRGILSKIKKIYIETVRFQLSKG